MKLIQEKIVIVCGIWLIILPFTGFPASWKTFLTIATGIVVVYLGALIYKGIRTHVRLEHSETKTETFTEVI